MYLIECCVDHAGEAASQGTQVGRILADSDEFNKQNKPRCIWGVEMNFINTGGAGTGGAGTGGAETGGAGTMQLLRQNWI